MQRTAEERFRAVYQAAYDDVLRFVQRRASSAEVDDVVGEAMLVAWRRVADLPDNLGDARAWLFGIARNCLLNSARADRRRTALGVRLATTGPPDTVPDEADAVVHRVHLAAAWAELATTDQEVIALSVFDGLTSAQAGAVLDITPEAFRLRLRRARAALRLHLEGVAPGRTLAHQKELHS